MERQTLTTKFAKEEDRMDVVEFAVASAFVLAATAAVWTLLGVDICNSVNELIDFMTL